MEEDATAEGMDEQLNVLARMEGDCVGGQRDGHGVGQRKGKDRSEMRDGGDCGGGERGGHGVEERKVAGGAAGQGPQRHVPGDGRGGATHRQPRGFANLLWKQLDHLGNAGFDPAIFWVDAYGNMLYLHADFASPLAWDIDHWFPCARGVKTVPSNLRIMQWQVCRKKLEFLMPWWDLQLVVSVNQFMSIFASKNSDFRNITFVFLLTHGASEELSSLQVVEAHAFPQHFSEMKMKVGLAPAAIVSSRGSNNSVLTFPLQRTGTYLVSS
ncbi:hypothetical protein Zm00014a_010814 [Zea mays]|uniref:Uncharacterized protein n=1 Tax=Zea mays TaxID=4577 RepID=A0A3L6FS30_MAIZE|nr:hypothetical protein Zm00014a_010814 [Zea mays]